MYISLIFATVPVGVVLLLSEILWRARVIKGERARKFIHILAGVWMAFWPFYVPFDGIFLLGIFSLTLLLYSRFTNLFHAIYAVKRRTYGELFFALALVVCATLGREPWVFTTSILLLAISDGCAAVIGRYLGKGNEYFVFGSKQLRKSIAGSVAYLLTAYFCMLVGYTLGGEVLSGQFAVWFSLPIGLAILENISPYGLDNILTPVLATVVLNAIL